MKINQILLSLAVLFCNLIYSQTGINTALKKELDSIFELDQIIREYIVSNTSEIRKSEIENKLGYKFGNIKEAYDMMKNTDSVHIKRIEVLIEKYGYPGKSLVGEPTNETMWYIIQHSNKIDKYYPVIKKAGKENEIPKTLVAKMYDRILVNTGKEQIYGTQGKFLHIKNKETGADELFQYIQPIKNPAKVNKRRKKIGFKTSVEDNAKELGIIYKEYTYKDLEKILN